MIVSKIFRYSLKNEHLDEIFLEANQRTINSCKGRNIQYPTEIIF